MNTRGNNSQSIDYDNSMGNFNPNFFNGSDGAAAVNLGYNLGKQ
jgi:hypothetical protein